MLMRAFFIAFQYINDWAAHTTVPRITLLHQTPQRLLHGREIDHLPLDEA